jgi:hypothetical protein
MSDTASGRTTDHVPGLDEESKQAEEWMREHHVASRPVSAMRRWPEPSPATCGTNAPKVAVGTDQASLTVNLPADLMDRLDWALEHRGSGAAIPNSYDEIVREALELYLSERFEA